MTEDRREEGFLRRWVRRKGAARDAKSQAKPSAAPAADAGLRSPTRARPEAAPANPSAPNERNVAASNDKAFDLAKLPAIESLTANSDFSAFMRPEVPEELRRQALRRLWLADPILSAPEKLDMHMLDYNAVPTFPEGYAKAMQAARQVVEAVKKVVGADTPAAATQTDHPVSVADAASKSGSGPAAGEADDSAEKPDRRIETSSREASGPTGKTS